MNGTRSIIVLVAVTVACGLFDSGPDFSHAAAMLNCGPADEGYVAVVLAREPVESAQPPFPYVRVLFWEPTGSLAGRSWDIAADLGPGAFYVTRPGSAHPAVSGRISVTSVDSTYTITGAVDLDFGIRGVVTEFTAPWINTGVTCP